VVGIVASRLKERYHKPVAVVTINNGIAKASSRSITGVDLGAAVQAAMASGLLLTGGGHAMAAGFTAEEAKLPELIAFLNERLSAAVNTNFGKVMMLDSAISVNAINVSLAQDLTKAAPYGTGNTEPRFAIMNARLVDCKEIGNGNLRVIFDDGGMGGKNKIFAVAFRALENPLGQTLVQNVGKTMNVAARIRLSQWQGKDRVETQIDDVLLV